MPKGYGKGPRKFENLLSPTPLDDKFVKEMEEDAKNEPGRKSEIEFLKAIKGSDVYECESGKLYDFITKNGKQKKVFESYTHRKGGKIDLYSIWEYDGMTFGVTIDPFGGYAGVSGKKSDLKKIWDEASKTDPEFYDDLNTIKEQLFDAPSEVKEAFNNVTKYFARKSSEENNKDWIKALRIGERTLKLLKDTEAVNCILSGGDPFIWDEDTEDIDKMKIKLENQVKHLKKVLQSRGIKVFDIYDEFGSNVRIGDEIIFYYENGVEELPESNVKTPRLYKGTLKSWDKQNLVATIITKDFDQTHYGLPKEVKIGQRLISKIK